MTATPVKKYTLHSPFSGHPKIFCPLCSSKTAFTKENFARHIWNRKKDHFDVDCDSIVRRIRTSDTEWHCPFYDCRLANGSSKLAVLDSFEAVYNHVLFHIKILLKFEECLVADSEIGPSRGTEICRFDWTVGQYVSSSRLQPMNPPPAPPAILEDDHYDIANPNPITPFLWYQYYHSDWYDKFEMIQDTCHTLITRNRMELAASQKHTREYINAVMCSPQPILLMDEEESSSSSSSSDPSTQRLYKRIKMVEDNTAKVYLDSKNDISARFKTDRIPSYVVPPL